MTGERGTLWVGLLSLGFAGLSYVLLCLVHFLTVRRLRRLPDIKNRLGFSMLPGDDAFNVALALSWPRSLMRLLDTSVTGWCFANADSVYRHTSRGERWVGRLCYGSVMLCLLTLMLYAALTRLT